MSVYNPIAMMAQLETAGVPRKQAEAIVGAIGDVRSDLLVKADLDAGLLGLRTDLDVGLLGLRTDLDVGLLGIRNELLVIRADFGAALNAMALRLFLAMAAVMALSMTTIGVLIEIHQA